MNQIKKSQKVPAVQLSNVSFAYEKNKYVLNNIDLSITENSRVAVIGPNGAGKSTLLTLLNGVRKAEGAIKILGTEINSGSIKYIRKTVGIVFQNPDDQLFCPTIFEDIAFGPLNLGAKKSEINTLVSETLDEVGLSGYEEREPHRLSFGERKLASLATAIAMSPRIIAFDEPTSNLDPYHRRKIINWINKNNKRTVIITSQDLDFAAETCDRVIIMNEGKLCADGSPAEILKDEKLLKKYYLELPLSMQKIQF